MTDPVTIQLLTSYVGARPAYLATLRLADRLSRSKSGHADLRVLKTSSRKKAPETRELSAGDYVAIIGTLERWGLVTSVPNEGGIVRWWSITDLGRTVLDSQPAERRRT